MAESNSSAIPTDEVASRRVGTVIKGKWTIDALLGTGGMASVYAATHRNGQRAALKIMHTSCAVRTQVLIWKGERGDIRFEVLVPARNIKAVTGGSATVDVPSSL